MCVSASWNDITVFVYYSMDVKPHSVTWERHPCLANWMKTIPNCQMLMAVSRKKHAICYLFIISSWILSSSLLHLCLQADLCFFLLLPVNTFSQWMLFRWKAWCDSSQMLISVEPCRGMKAETNNTSKCGLPRQISTVSWFHGKFEWKKIPRLQIWPALSCM